MAGNKAVISICLSGGEFDTNEEGSLAYKGGEAHAMEIDDKMNYKDFKEEVAEMFNCSTNTMCLKYFLPNNKKTLITISNDKDLKRMIKFHKDADNAEIYVMNDEVVAPEASFLPGSRSSRTTLSEDGALMDAITGVVDDASEEVGLLLDGTFDIVEDTNNFEADANDFVADIDVSTEIATPLAIAGFYDEEKHIKRGLQCQNDITGVGQRFNTVHDFRESLQKHAIANQFAFTYKKNDSHRVTVKCKMEGCPWRIHASRLATTQLICIKNMNPVHTCEGISVTGGYKATRRWIASIVKEKLKVSPNYKPKDIVNDVKEEYGIQLNYYQAWRGKEVAKEQIQGSYKEAYNQLPVFCQKIMETNPGSLATFTTKDDSSFHRLFITFHASLYGFEQGCRPLIFLDSILLRSKYQGTVLAATSVDGDDAAFPVAFAVVDAETDDNWRWFLQQLKTALSTSRDGDTTTDNPLTLTHTLIIVADREKGLRESIADVFNDIEACHSYCLRYLSEQLIRELKGQFSHEVKRLLVEDLFTTAFAATVDGFQMCVENIKSLSMEAYQWIMNSEPDHWANAFFPGARYNHLTSNFGELFYNWVSDANELPITQMVDLIRGKIMELIYTRRTESSQWLSRLTPTMEEVFSKESVKVHNLQVLTPTGNRFEVRGDSIEVVDLDQFDCSCKGWKITGLPCSHAIAVIGCLGRDPYDYCGRYFTCDCYRLTYSESINAIPNLERLCKKDRSKACVTVTPPPNRRPPGRPSIKKSVLESGIRQLQCSRCKGTGHNKSTCKEVLEG